MPPLQSWPNNSRFIRPPRTGREIRAYGDISYVTWMTPNRLTFFITRYLFYAFFGADQSCFHVMLQFNWKGWEIKFIKKGSFGKWCVLWPLHLGKGQGYKCHGCFLMHQLGSPLVPSDRVQSFRPLQLSPCSVCHGSPWSNAALKIAIPFYRTIANFVPS